MPRLDLPAHGHRSQTGADDRVSLVRSTNDGSRPMHPASCRRITRASQVKQKGRSRPCPPPRMAIPFLSSVSYHRDPPPVHGPTRLVAHPSQRGQEGPTCQRPPPPRQVRQTQLHDADRWAPRERPKAQVWHEDPALELETRRAAVLCCAGGHAARRRQIIKSEHEMWIKRGHQ